MAEVFLRERSRELRRLVAAGEPLDSVVDEMFELVCRASSTALGLELFDEQLRAGRALYEGNVVEMQTGEGKTLAAVAPVAVLALERRGVHVLTHNDYLAHRDARWMGPVYELLGLSVGCVQQDMTTTERKEAYRADVTYGTAKEAGFDLLRDQQCLDRRERVHRPFHAALVDEADSILIDEARIPLVIAGSVDVPRDTLPRLARIVRDLEHGLDFDMDEHARNLFLTDRGVRRAESLLNCGNLFAPTNGALLAELRSALHAEALLKRDVDYIVRGGAIELVDELTGRVAENRHWPDGLQAALEAKEGITIRGDGVVLGSITMQHLLKLYPHLSGMTGTALAASEELDEVYGLDVVSIPTHEPSIRRDHPDVVFTTKRAKTRAVVDEIVRVHETGQPILVGTASVAESEALADALRHAGIPLTVLNAKNDEQESEAVGRAGRRGAVTISTNMAGRGTDIRLDGAEALGGLYVIGTNRHESRRIDDQLRGRAGRQGDPGMSRFFVSLEDDLVVRYGIRELIPDRLLPDGHDGAIDHPRVRREIARCQRRVEGAGLDIRKRLYHFSGFVEDQRRLVDDWRQRVLDGVEQGKLLAAAAPERWETLKDGDAVERRLTLLAIDRVWSEHLTELGRVRDEIHLVGLDGRTPLVEFCRIAKDMFETIPERVEHETLRAFEALTIPGSGVVDLDGDELRGPSSTWTYLVNDQVFGGNVFLGLASRPNIGLVGAVMLGPVLFAWAVYEHWRKRKRRRAMDG